MNVPPRKTGSNAVDLTALLGAGADASVAAQHRNETLELWRQRNLNSITSGAFLRTNATSLESPDWVAEFMECAKDSAEPTIQDLWSRLLAGEMECPDTCSKRTLRLVRSLSKKEALLINEIARTVCYLEDAAGEKTPYVNVVVQHARGQYDNSREKITTLYDDQQDLTIQKHRALINCGFLSSMDYDFTFSGEGHLDLARFALSAGSPRRIIMGKRALVMAPRQPGLLHDIVPDSSATNQKSQMMTPAASVNFYTWKLTPEGHELFSVLDVEPLPELLPSLAEACRRGGLSATIQDA